VRKIFTQNKKKRLGLKINFLVELLEGKKKVKER